MIKATRRTRLHVSAVALVAALTLAGCSDSPPDRAGTVGESSAATGESAPEESPETEEVELDAVGRELTNKEAEAALPPVSALPTGWSVDPENTLNDDSESDAEPKETIEPAKCQAIMDDLSEEQDGTTTTFKISSLSFPNLGEESAAIRMAGTSEGMAMGVDMVTIRAGHNIVTLSQASVGGATGSDALEKAARATVTKMESK